MYNESEFSIKGFLLKVILVVLFVFLLMWLLPRPNLDPLYNRIFNENILEMKEAAKGYFTVERLPKEVGDKEKLTLEEMIQMKLLLPIIDSDGVACDTTKSYVEIMKTETEYIIKVNLNCTYKTDYIIEHMGCYDICPSKCVPTVEEKKEAEKKPVVVKPKDPKNPEKPKNPDKPKEPEKPKEPVVVYEYQYTKTNSSSSSYWTNWSEPIPIKVNETIQFGYSNYNTIQREDLGKKETIVAYDIKWETVASKVEYRDFRYKVGTYKVSACKEYDYVKYDTTGTTYKTTTVYEGNKTFDRIPSDTDTVKYTNITPRYDACLGETCSDKIYYTADVTRTKKVAEVSNNTSGVIDATCSNLETTNVDVYATAKQKVIVPTQVKKTVTPRYAMIHFYRERKLVSSSSSSTSEKWSTNSNDKTLLNQGYKATGKKRVKK